MHTSQHPFMHKSMPPPPKLQLFKCGSIKISNCISTDNQFVSKVEVAPNLNLSFCCCSHCYICIFLKIQCYNTTKYIYHSSHGIYVIILSTVHINMLPLHQKNNSNKQTNSCTSNLEVLNMRRPTLSIQFVLKAFERLLEAPDISTLERVKNTFFLSHIIHVCCNSTYCTGFKNADSLTRASICKRQVGDESVVLLYQKIPIAKVTRTFFPSFQMNRNSKRKQRPHSPTIAILPSVHFVQPYASKTCRRMRQFSELHFPILASSIFPNAPLGRHSMPQSRHFAFANLAS